MSDYARSGSFGAQSLQALRQLFRDLSDPYRPELHYMRGPGPKWREKHGSQKGSNREAVRPHMAHSGPGQFAREVPLTGL
jgi:hypothetical protein